LSTDYAAGTTPWLQHPAIIWAQHNANDESALRHILVTQNFINEARRLGRVEINDNNCHDIANNARTTFATLADCTQWDASEGNLGDLKNTIAAQEAAIQELQQQLTDARTIATRLAALEGPGQARIKPADIPDPDTFDGKRDDLRIFITMLRLKVEGNADRFPNIQHQLRYAFSFLRGAAYNTLEPYVRNNEIDFEDLDGFIQALETAFGDPDRAHTAQRDLERLQQENREFTQHRADFQRSISIVQYDGRARRHALERGLNREVNDTLVLQDTPPDETRGKFVVQINRFDDRVHTRAQEQCGTHNPTAPRAPQAPCPPAPTPTPPQSTTDVGAQPGPTNLNAGRQRISQAERLRRIQQNLCNYCGGPGHFAMQCPVRPQHPQGQQQCPLRGAADELLLAGGRAPDANAQVPQSRNE